MKLKTKAALVALLCLIFLAFTTGCSIKKTPYQVNNEENYTVSVKYDANGGLFTTNTSVIVDSYNPDELPVNGEGKAEIALLAPEDESRKETFKVSRNGYFFAGWYETRTEVKGADGKTEYTYADKWDFEKDRVKIDPKGKHSAEKPQTTLYAAWIPLFEIEIYDAATGEELEGIKFDPTVTNEFTLPAWNTETGAMDMNDFPQRKDFTFESAYMDKELKNPVTEKTLIHPGIVNYDNATAVDPNIKLYVNWTEGNWFRIETAEQFIKNSKANGSYEILADLDFEGLEWKKSLATETYTGTIIGNGHVLKNISYTFANIIGEQQDVTKTNDYVGIFGNVSESAKIYDVTFENVTITLEKGTRFPGSGFGIFAGSISENAVIENVTIKDSVLQLSGNLWSFATDDYSVGLVCGMGNYSLVTYENLNCINAEETPSKYEIAIDGNTVILTVPTVDAE